MQISVNASAARQVQILRTTGEGTQGHPLQDVVLIAPTFPPKSRGREAGRAAFLRAFRALPDLRAEVVRWSTRNETLFIEFTSSATIGGHLVTWTSVDRFMFRNGEAVERINDFDPSRIRRAFFRNPRGLWQMMRFRFAL